MIDFIEEKIPVLLKAKLKTEQNSILNFEKICQLLSPENALKRGFSLSLLNGKMISSSKQAKEGDILETVFFDGKLKSKVLSDG
jgi:exodeoxyribonuclease VII large subunit